MANKATRVRSKNFTATEVSVLVEEVEKRQGTLFGPLKGPSLTQHHRDRAWQQTLEAVNAVAPVLRTTAELKKKFKDLKTRTKQKANSIKVAARKTGGGENEANIPFNTIETKIIQFIGTDSIEGIVGGVDTFRQEVINIPSEEQPSTSTATLPPDMDAENPTAMALPSFSPIVPNCKAKIPSNLSENLDSRPVAPQPAPPIPKRPKKNKTLALEEIKKTTALQEKTNTLLEKLVQEFTSFKQEFLQLKKREVELLEEDVNIRKRLRTE